MNEQQIKNIISEYLDFNLNVHHIYQASIPHGTMVTDTTTLEDVCGFVIPISGKAEFTIEGKTYLLEPGKILHAGSGMKLSKKVISTEDWVYILIHYKVLDSDKKNSILDKLDYAINVSPDDMLRIQHISNQILNCYQNKCEYSSLKNKAKLYDIINILLEANSSNQLDTTVQKMDYIKSYIIKNINENYSISQLSSLIDMSPQQFSYHFYKIVGIKPKKYIISLKMDLAKDLIRNSGLSLKKISESIGISDPLYFSRLFNKSVGCSPSQYKENS